MADNRIRQQEIGDTGAATTIAAISTPPGVSGIAVLRLSGPEAGGICDQLFQPVSQRFAPASQMEAYSLGVGYWYTGPDKEDLVDQVVLACFRAPHSYTGEDLYEISCHGSMYARKKILESLLAAGAEPAGPGEFTRRAFINGKLDLSQAEAVMDLINAEAGLQNRAALQQLKGRLAEEVRSLRQTLFQAMSQLELILEFPEHEDRPETRQRLTDRVDQVHDRLTGILSSFQCGRMIKEGMMVVLAGKPNAGKSSLLNCLAGWDQAIVTSQPGTTRDTLEAYLDLGGLPVRLVDTAGLRESTDQVEQAGITRALAAIEDSDLILWLVAADQPDSWRQEAQRIKSYLAQDKTVLPVASKQDLDPEGHLAAFLDREFDGVEPVIFSKFLPESLDQVREAILAFVDRADQLTNSGLVLTNTRHQKILTEVAGYLDQAREALAAGLGLDILATILRLAAEKLAEITGEAVTESLIENIFAEFCVGK